jgi:DNA repair photolyase
VRWDELRLTEDAGQASAGTMPLLPRGAVTRTFDTPEFAGMTFHEVTCRSALNKVPDTSRMPFRWTVNPYRGCSMACVYCLAGDTPILMADGRPKPLAEVKVGDEIYGTRRVGLTRQYVVTTVSAHWQTTKRAFRITLADGTRIVASADHRFLSEGGWKYVTGTMQGARRRPYLRTGNSLLGFGAMTDPPKVDADYRRGYLTGMIRGDGSLVVYEYSGPGSRVRRVHRFRLALVDAKALDRSRSYLAELGVPTTTFRFSEATEKHAAVTAIRTSRGDAYAAITNHIAWPEEASDSWRRGFLAGIFDAEGSHSHGVLRITNTDDEIIEQTSQAMTALGVPHVVEKTKVPNGLRNVRVIGGLSQRMRFLQMVDPAITRKRDLVGFSVKCRTPLDVVAIEDLGLEIPMFDITTGTGDFIANGVISHNCFARKTHEYLDLDSGADFDSQVVVKTNVGEVLRRELRRPSWVGEHVAMGTNVDCYQRVEGRYRLMREVIPALTEAANPFSILTKGALILRDLDLLAAAAEVTDVSAALSIGSVDRDIRHQVEPGAPPPARRLEVVRRLSDAGIPTGVLMAPVLPYLTDSDEQLEQTVAAIAASGATHVSPIVLHLRPGAREWWQAWLRRERPDLLPRYAQLYGTHNYAPKTYQDRISETVCRFAEVHGVGRERAGMWRNGHDHAARTPVAPPPAQAPAQLALL